MSNPSSTDRSPVGDVHLERCNGTDCPCYMEGAVEVESLRAALAEAVDDLVMVLGPMATTQPIADDLHRWRVLANPLFRESDV